MSDFWKVAAGRRDVKRDMHVCGRLRKFCCASGGISIGILWELEMMIFGRWQHPPLAPPVASPRPRSQVLRSNLQPSMPGAKRSLPQQRASRGEPCPLQLLVRPKRLGSDSLGPAMDQEVQKETSVALAQLISRKTVDSQKAEKL